MPHFAPRAHREKGLIMNSDPYRSDPSILTVADVAAALHASKKSVYALIRSGELASFRRGRQYLIRKADLQAYQEQLEKSNAVKFNIELPQSIIDSFASHLVAEIRKFYDSEAGQSVFAEWLKQREDS